LTFTIEDFRFGGRPEAGDRDRITASSIIVFRPLLKCDAPYSLPALSVEGVALVLGLFLRGVCQRGVASGGFSGGGLAEGGFGFGGCQRGV